MIIVLVAPEIPQNTGNIVRTCNVTGTKLILVPPLGFSTHSRHLKRAGLDYWEDTEIERVEDLDLWLEENSHPFTFFSSHATTSYHQVDYAQDHVLIFGSESKGLPPKYREKYPQHFAKIPMMENKRCLNLATSCGIALYQALLHSNALTTF